MRIPTGKLALRPSFLLTVLNTADARSRLLDALDWFMKAANNSNPSE